MNLLGGQPYLTRKLLYTLAVEKQSWEQVFQNATHDQGPFADHLRHQLWHLQQNKELLDALKEIIHYRRKPDEILAYRLLRAGLIKGSGELYAARCDLYQRYFNDKLR